MSLRAVVVVASTLLATACSNVMTVDDVVTESAAIRDDRLIADWYQVDGVERAHISRGASNDYVVSYVDKEDSAQLRGRLGRMGKMVVMDLFPDMKQWSARGETGIPFHVTVAIEVFGDSVAAYGLDGDSVLAVLAGGKIRVPWSRFNGDVLLHGDAVAMRSAVAQLFQQRRALGKPNMYVRR